jgi:uncharacterized protein (DUF3084 family)
MGAQHHAFGSAEVREVRVVREEREAVERRIRATLSEIRDAIDQLERTCRQGRITPEELAEERDLLRAQEHAFRPRIE